MCDIEVCRICLRSDTKLYKIEKFKLKIFYEKFNGHPIGNRDALPRYFCFECAALLHKFYKFREKSDFSQRALRDILLNGYAITYKAVNDLLSKNRKTFKNNSITQILISNENVKTYNVKTEAINYDDDQCSLKVEEAINDCYNDYYSDDNVKFEDPATDPVAGEYISQTEVVDDSVAVEAFDKKINHPKLIENKQAEKETKNSIVETKKKLCTIVSSEISDSENEDTFDMETIQPEYTEQPKTETANTKKSKITSKRNLRSKEKDGFITETKPKKIPQTHSPDTKKSKFKSRFDIQKGHVLLNSGNWKKTTLSEDSAVTEFEARALDKQYLNAAYKCTDCFRGFSKKNMLDRHIPLRHSEAIGSLQCRFCKMRFKRPSSLKSHMLQHFVRYECLRCNLVCNLETSAVFHEEYHNGVLRKCTHCHKEFRHMSTFYTHLRSHRSEHMCALCGESFVSPLGLRLHKKAKHSVGTENQEVSAGSTFCETCKIRFETKEAYDKHYVHSAMHTGEFKELDGNVFKDLLEKDEDDKDESDQISKPLIARKSRVEKTVSAVRKSLSIHTKAKKPTMCHMCGKHFDTQSACMKHHLAEHPGISFHSSRERIVCEICGASLAPGSLATHLNTHTRRRTFACDTCGRAFTNRNMLSNHIATHTGERNHACNICGKRFAQSSSIHLHHRTVHLKQPYPKRNRSKRIEKPNTELGLFGDNEDDGVWRHF